MIRVPRCGRGRWAVLGIAVGLLCLSLPFFPNDLQAFGNNLAATAVIAGGLVWHMLHPLPDDAAGALSAAEGELQPAMPRPTPLVFGGKIENVQRAATSAGSRPHRRRFRQQPGAAVCPAADQIDLGRSGLCRRLQGGRGSSGQGYRDARFRRPGQADGRSSGDRRQERGERQAAARGRMCCSTAITMCSRSIRSVSGTVRRSNPP